MDWRPNPSQIRTRRRFSFEEPKPDVVNTLQIEESNCIFAVELEFLFKSNGEGARVGDSRENWKEESMDFEHFLRRDIASTLCYAGIWAVPSDPTSSEAAKEETEKILKLFQEFRSKNPDPSDDRYYERGIWTVSHAPSCKVDENRLFRGDRWVGICVKSPDLTAAPEVAGQIKTVCDTLKASFYVAMHSSARFRVRVRRRDRKFGREDMLRLVHLLHFSGPLLDLLHPAHCQPGSPLCLGLQFTKQLGCLGQIDMNELKWSDKSVLEFFDEGKAFYRTTPMLSVPTLPGGHFGFFAALKLYELGARYKTLEEVAGMLALRTPKDGGKLPAAYDFEGVANAQDGTFGFGQHTGTLYDERIQHWVSICLKLIDLVTDSEKSHFDKIMNSLGYMPYVALVMSRDPAARPARDQSYNITAFLKDIHCHRAATYFAALPPNPSCPENPHTHRRPAYDVSSLPAATRSSPQYQFGVEIETLIPSGKKGDRSDDPHPSDERWYSCGSYFREAGIRTKLGKVFDSVGMLSFRGDDDVAFIGDFQILYHLAAHKSGHYFNPDYDPVYQGWNVHHDGSLTTCDDPALGYTTGFQGIEMSSPITPFSAVGFATLNRAISQLRNQMRWLLDPTCSVHVHVGNTLNIWTLLELKKVVTMVWFSEFAFSNFIHAFRRSGRWAALLSTHSAYTRETDTPYTPATSDLYVHVPVEELPNSEFASMRALWAETTSGEYWYGMSSIHSGKCGLFLRCRPLQTDDEVEVYAERHNKICAGTFEFRYHHGCMDTEVILQWVRLCVSLVRAAHESTPATFHETIKFMIDLRERKLPLEDMLPEFLGRLGLDDSVEFWIHEANRVKKYPELEEGQVTEDCNWSGQVERDAFHKKFLEEVPSVSPEEAEAVQKIIKVMEDKQAERERRRGR